MSAITLNGQRVVSGSITIPFYGAWSADVILASESDIPDASVLVVADLTLNGTVIRKASFAGSRSARIVGGAGGWRKDLPARGYSHAAGVLLSTIIGDAATECGERIAGLADRSIGAHYARERSKAERVLNLLTGGTWWLAPDGSTHFDTRDASPIVTPFTVTSWLGGKGQFEIASESIKPWQPGRTFTSPTVPVVQTISSVTIDVDNDGKLRLTVLNTDGAVERLRSSIRSIVRAESPTLNYSGVWEYKISATLGLGLSTTIDASSTSSTMPALTQVPLAPGVGAVTSPIVGTMCRVRFVNSDPSRPEVVSLGATTEHVMTVEACALLIYNTLVALMATAGGAALTAAILQPLLGAAITAAITAQAVPAPPGLILQTAAALALQAGFATGTTPSPAMFAAWKTAIAALSTKVPDVSGSYPSVGIPNQ